MIGGNKFTVVSFRWTGAASMKFSPISSGSKSATFRSTCTPPGHTAKTIEVHEGLPWSFIIDHRSQVMDYLKNADDWESDEGLAFIRYYTRRILR